MSSNSLWDYLNLDRIENSKIKQHVSSFVYDFEQADKRYSGISNHQKSSSFFVDLLRKEKTDNLTEQERLELVNLFKVSYGLQAANRGEYGSDGMLASVNVQYYTSVSPSIAFMEITDDQSGDITLFRMIHTNNPQDLG